MFAVAHADRPRGGALLPRVELYRLLADEGRLRLLALSAEEELSVGELSELSGESQPQVSRKMAPLRQAGLLSARREGTRTFLRAEPEVLAQDPVLRDALEEGRRLCLEDGSLARVPLVVARREEGSARFFEKAAPDEAQRPRADLGPFASYLFALSPLLSGRRLAVDAGAGEGHLLDVLAPLYERVFAIEKSRAQIARCARHVAERGFANVRIVEGSFEDVRVLEEVDREGGADLVFASRILHHVATPAAATKSLARMLRSGGHLVVLDYLAHDDERMREAQGDVWLGFLSEELSRFVEGAGLFVIHQARVPDALFREGPDAHLGWQIIVGKKRA